MENISETDFIKAYNSFPPNKYVKFLFKYFSEETLKKDSWLKGIVIGILSSFFLLGFIGTAIKLDSTFIGSVTIAFSIFLSVIVLNLFVAVLMNNARINKIRKALGGISKKDFNHYSDEYLN